MVYTSADHSYSIRIPDLASAVSVNSDGKFYILLIKKNDSSEYWAYHSLAERDYDLEHIVELQAAVKQQQ